MAEREEGQEVFLQIEVKKGNFQEDEDSFYFDVEASNENLDFEKQAILQRALLNSKDYYLTNGVVSKDHLHKRIENGVQITDEQYVIGEPVKVYTDGKSTRIKGRLYKNNKHAVPFIDLLRAKSTRVKASVGGIIPKIVKNVKDGTEKVVSFLWNDVALTIAPVNFTVGPATGILAKRLTGDDFVKALSVGYGTDSREYTGGRALQKEEVEGNTVNKTQDYETAIADLMGAVSVGEIKTTEEAQDFLKDYGITAAVALDVIRGIVRKHKEFAEVLPMGKKNGSGNLFTDIIDKIQKSMGGGTVSKGGKTDPDYDEEDVNARSDDEPGDDEDALIDAEDVIKALTDKVEELENGQQEILKALKDLTEQSAQDAEFKKSMGEGMIALMEQYGEIAKQPMPRRGVGGVAGAGISKGNVGGGTVQKHRQFTVSDQNQLKGILTKAVAAGELTLHDCGKLETQINKSIRDPNFQISPEYAEFLRTKLAS